MKKIGSITPTTTRLLMSWSVTTMSWWYCTGVEISKLLMSPEKRLTAAQQMGSGQTTHTDENVGSSPIRPMGVTSKNETGACRRLESMRLCIFQLALSPIS